VEIDALVVKLLNGKSHIPLVLQVRDGLGLQVIKYKKKKRWYLDTDLHPHSNFDYSDEGQDKLKNLATNSQLSDGVQIESQTKRVFCVSFAEDTKKGVEYTYGAWVEAIRLVLTTRNCIKKIS
jgi:hypothetical protein